MPAWAHTLDIKDIFHDDAKEFEEKRDEIVRRIRAAAFYDEEEIGYLVTDLAEADDVEDFDYYWNNFYDWADYARVWVATF
jgi:hypothetical protein